MKNYIKFSLSFISMLIALYCLLIGGYAPWIFLIGFSVVVITGDLLLPQDYSINDRSASFIYNIFLYINFPLVIIMVFLVVYYLSPSNLPAINKFIEWVIGIDIASSKSNITFFQAIGYLELSGLFTGAMATNIGHELTHRKRSWFDMFIGNWLLAFTWDCTFAIEHVYGHHKNVGLSHDPATAKREQGLYHFIFSATYKEHRDALTLEQKQLLKKGYSFFSLNNKMLSGYARSILLTSIAYLVGGYIGVIIFNINALIGKLVLEVTNYMEHYGLIRVEGQLVMPRHSWNTNRVFSSYLLFNLTRHSSHHERANLEYWNLRPYRAAPELPLGYLTSLYILIFFPYIFRWIMKKQLQHWDNSFASKGELEILGKLAEN